MSKYLAHKVIREDRPDGSIILRPGYDIGDVVDKSSVWLDTWAQKTPDAVFLAERSGEGWRTVSYGEAHQQVRAIAASLLARGLDQSTPILVISGNGVDHGLLTLAAQYIGVPTVPLAEQYALIPAAHDQLRYCAELVAPKMVFADDGAKYGAALGMDVFEGVEKLVSGNADAGMTTFDSLLAGSDLSAVDAAAALVGPDTVAKYLMTSGSTSNPKGVITTQRMICANQTMIADALPFLKTRPPRILDWLPWNHVFGGSHNFNMMLANGGALYIDGGKPVKPLFDLSLENNRMMNSTMAFNVPIAFANLRDAMRSDQKLKEHFFEDLDMLFYAGASLPQDIWADLEEMAIEVKGEAPLFNTSWGMTETAPGSLIQHEPSQGAGIIGVPMTGTEFKLIPDEDMRCDLRLKGPNITPGYLNDPDKTRELFDDEGYLISGDAVKLVDPEDMTKGLRFDGRMSEDFKLMSGTWVRAANLRLEVLQALAPLAQDIVICGADKAEIGLMVIPSVPAREMAGEDAVEGALSSAELRETLADKLRAMGPRGSSARVSRLMVLAEPPSMGDGEITAKGNLNFRKILTRRAVLLERLYDDAEPAMTKV